MGRADRGAASAPRAVRRSAAAYREELVALEAVDRSPATLRTCHRDLWADNLRAEPGGELCLIDWDNAGLGDPAGEVALVLFEFGRNDPAGPRPVCDVHRRRRSRPRPVTGDFTMPIAQLNHIGERACRLWLDADTNDARDRAASLADEFAGDPLTRALIHRLLDAVGTTAACRPECPERHPLRTLRQRFTPRWGLASSGPPGITVDSRSDGGPADEGKTDG